MDYCSWENISCKYILKKIFSYIKVSKALEIIKVNKRIRYNLDITLFHYQYYYFCTLFKEVNIESINDILNSYYLQSFPEDIRYDLVLNYIKNRKLFKDEYVYLNIEDKITKDFIEKIKGKQINNDFKYIIGNIEDKKIDQTNIMKYNDTISKIISSDIMNKILFDFSFFTNSKLSENYRQNIKLLHLHINIYQAENYNISFLDNLEYLSITFEPQYSKNIGINKVIKIIITEKQIKNIKTLKIIEPIESNYTFNNIIFETENKNDRKYFENLNELHINEAFLNKIKINSKKLQKLNIIYDFRDRIYTIDYLENSFDNLLEQYLGLTCLNISLYYFSDYEKLIKHNIKEIFSLFVKIQNINNYSFNILNIYEINFYKYNGNIRLSIKNLPNGKIIIKGDDIPVDIYQDYLKEIEKIDLYFSYRKVGGKSCLYIEENNSISSLKKIRINNCINETLYLPIKSFSSLNSLELNINEIYFQKEFPLFSKDSSIRFNNLEYISLNTETFDMINILATNFKNTPNLRFLSIICAYICNTNFPYLREILSKIVVLKKLHTLIINDSKEINLYEVNKYYSIFPELKNSHIKFCYINN